jgi:hypothetical protein
MDISNEKYLVDDRSTRAEQIRVVAALSATHPVTTPFLVAPFVAECSQGAHRRRVIVLAERGDTVLYADTQTHQFGIAFLSASGRERLLAGREYPSVDLAVLMFVGDRAALDPD